MHRQDAEQDKPVFQSLSNLTLVPSQTDYSANEIEGAVEMVVAVPLDTPFTVWLGPGSSASPSIRDGDCQVRVSAGDRLNGNALNSFDSYRALPIAPTPIWSGSLTQGSTGQLKLWVKVSKLRLYRGPTTSHGTAKSVLPIDLSVTPNS